MRSLWQALLAAFASCFTAPAFRSFQIWITGLTLCPDEHTVTGSATAAGAVSWWRRLEYLAESAAWSLVDFEAILAGLIQNTAVVSSWHGYNVVAVDDSKIHRSSPKVWGTCTYHNYSARCPNRAATVRALNVVQLGRLLPPQAQGGHHQPALYLPCGNRFYFRKSQLPFDPDRLGHREPFRTKCQLAVELIRAHAQAVPIAASGRHLAIFDGCSALSVKRERNQDGGPSCEYGPFSIPGDLLTITINREVVLCFPSNFSPPPPICGSIRPFVSATPSLWL